jgi:hypothetical protein
MAKSIVTEYEEISAFSQAPAECRHHLVYGRGLRELADQDGLWIPLTNAEHNMSPDGLLYQIHSNPTAEKLSKMLGQIAWEKHTIITSGCSEHEARQFFRNRYGISYL